MEELLNRIIFFLKKIVQLEMVKVFSLTSLSTLVRMATGLISVKVVSVIIGPAGIALLGQLNNFSTILMSFASGGINNGITKYIAEYKEAEDKIKLLLSTALRITLCCSLLVGLFLIIFSRYLSGIIMQAPEYGYVFIIFGLTLIFYALNSMFISILNGYKEFKKYVSINIVGSLIGLIFSICFVLVLGLKGALISAVTYQSIMFLATFFMLRKFTWFSWPFFKEKFNILVAKQYFRYSLMAIVTAITVPVSQLLLRGYIITDMSSVEAGWWEAMNRLSSMYLLVITSSFGVYYLPRLSELNSRTELKNEILKAYKLIMPILLIGFSLVYILRFFIIRLLFSSEFLQMENLFIWQLLGDLFKISSWLLAFLMIAKSMIRMFVLTEILFSVLYVVIGMLLLKMNGIVGITQAYLVNYILYMLFMLILFRKLIFIK